MRKLDKEHLDDLLGICYVLSMFIVLGLCIWLVILHKNDLALYTVMGWVILLNLTDILFDWLFPRVDNKYKKDKTE